MKVRVLSSLEEQCQTLQRIELDIKTLVQHATIVSQRNLASPQGNDEKEVFTVHPRKRDVYVPTEVRPPSGIALTTSQARFWWDTKEARRKFYTKLTLLLILLAFLLGLFACYKGGMLDKIEANPTKSKIFKSTDRPKIS